MCCGVNQAEAGRAATLSLDALSWLAPGPVEAQSLSFWCLNAGSVFSQERGLRAGTDSAVCWSDDSRMMFKLGGSVGSHWWGSGNASRFLTLGGGIGFTTVPLGSAWYDAWLVESSEQVFAYVQPKFGIDLPLGEGFGLQLAFYVQGNAIMSQWVPWGWEGLPILSASIGVDIGFRFGELVRHRERPFGYLRPAPVEVAPPPPPPTEDKRPLAIPAPM